MKKADMTQVTRPLSDQQAHSIALSIRGAEFEPSAVDWNLVQELTAPVLAITDVPRTAKSRATAGAVAVIRKGGGSMHWRGQLVNPETVAAIFDVFSDGKHRKGCPGSPDGRHQWAAAETNPTGTSSVRIPPKNRRCQRCGLQG
jgi:hypothetical protein